MDYEKAYKDALNRAKHALDCHNQGMVSTDVSLITSMFPELKESEGEKERKALVEMVRDRTGDELWEDYNVHKEEVLVWLKKQGESYTKRDVDIAYVEGMASAKDELEKQAEVVSDKDDIEAEEKGIREAFNKIEDEKQGKQKSQRMISAEAKEAMYGKPSDKVEQKSSWTKEDDAMLDTIEGWLDTLCEYLKDSQCEYIPNVKYCIDKLKSLKQRCAWKPSDEQIEILDMILTNESLDDNIARILRELREQLKKLREDKL